MSEPKPLTEAIKIGKATLSDPMKVEKLRAALIEARDYVADEIELTMQGACPRLANGRLDRARVDPLTKQSLKADRAVLRGIKAALKETA